MSVIKGRYRVTVGGNDITSTLRRLLLDLSVELASGNQNADSANITHSDPGGLVRLPQKRDPVKVYLNDELTFDGFVSQVSCGLSKGSGRTISVSCSSMDADGPVKEQQFSHKDNATFKDVAEEWAAKAGLQLQVSGQIASQFRGYWLIQKESFPSWAQRMSKELGGTFRVVGNRAFIVDQNSGLSASGKPLTSVLGSTGPNGNILTGNVTPIISRPKYKSVAVESFSLAKAEHEVEVVNTALQTAEAKLSVQLSTASPDHAKQRGNGSAKQSEREQGAGSVTIVGNELAQPEARFNVQGWRPGVNGAYLIDSVSHTLSKDGGFVTTLNLRHPEGGAGVDDR